jgi:aminoglycoside phosphotransferase (APT) family kinase protein
MTKFVNPINSFLHGDLHKGNILINKSKLVGVIDFGKSIIGDIHKDFSHHMRHYPEYIDTIIKSYEINTGIKLSKDKIILYAFLKDMEKLIYHVDKYKTHKYKQEKNFAKADELRKEIGERGYIVEDTADGFIVKIRIRTD